MALTHEFDNCSAISDEDFQAVLDSCEFRDGKQVNDLIAKTYTPYKFNERVAEKHFNKPDSAYNYFTGFYPNEVWEDGQGQDEFSEIYYAPVIGYDFSRFIKTMQICDPNAADECNTCYEELPDGARGVLPPMEMYKWGVQTPRQCIANMRHIRHFRQWGNRLLRGWHSIDEQIQNMFFTFASIRLTGHKVVLQGTTNSEGQVVAVANNDPKNPFQNFVYNYQQPKFPQIIDADLIMPLEFQYLEFVARYWSQFNADNHVAIGDRGQKVWEMWHPEDWYRDNVLQNPEYFQALKEYKPASTMAGYSLDTPREILGNWAMRSMPFLPRFVEATTGGLIPIDNFVNEDVEFGQRPVPAGRDWMNAPFLMATIPSPKSGKILHRPPLSSSVEGWPILPIMGDGGWVIRNDYDKDCNKDLNMPYSQRRYEIGFKLEDPDAAISVIFRNKVFPIVASNQCDWAPNTNKKEPPTHDCATSITCSDNQRQASAIVTTSDLSSYVECSCETCGDDTIMRLKLTREAYKKDYTPFDCDCGDTMVAQIADDTGQVVREEDVVLIEQRPWPSSLYWVQLDSALADGECIKALRCYDDTPTTSAVLDCWDENSEGRSDLNGNLELALDNPLSCNVGDDVDLEVFDSEDNSLGTVTVTIVTEDSATGLYEVSGAGDLECDLGFADSDHIVATCA